MKSDDRGNIFDAEQPMFAQPGPSPLGETPLTSKEQELVDQEKKFIESISRGRGGVLGGAGEASAETTEALTNLADLVRELILEARTTREVIRAGQLELSRRLDALSGKVGEPKQLESGDDEES